MCDLTNALLEEWSKMPINTLLNLVDSLPRRVEAVLAAQLKLICDLRQVSELAFIQSGERQERGREKEWRRHAELNSQPAA